jgi:hypothetical protein
MVGLIVSASLRFLFRPLLSGVDTSGSGAAVTSDATAVVGFCVPLPISGRTGVYVGVAQHDRYAELGGEESIQNVQRVEHPLTQISVWSCAECLRVTLRTSMQAGFIGEFWARVRD